MSAPASPSAQMDASPQAIACLAVGEMDGMADLYVARLHGMLARRFPAPFRLICFSDRERKLPPSVELWPGCTACWRAASLHRSA